MSDEPNASDRRRAQLRQMVLSGHLTSERRSIVEDEWKRADEIDRAVATLRHWGGVANARGTEDALLFNLGLFICLFERDQGILKVDALLADESDRVRLSFIARQWVTLLYEASGTIRQKALSKPLRDFVQALEASAMVELNEINKLATRFWDSYQRQMKQWRNVACAHRDFDAFVQAQAIEEIDLLTIMNIAGDFTVVTRRLLPLVSDCLETTATLNGALTTLERGRNRQ